jgi:hypothetical protein
MPRCRQLDRGEPCILSRNDGVNDWGTIVSVAESPILPGLYWAGTDDGNIQVSRDRGATWTEVSRNLPGGTTRYYVSRVEASHHDPATAWVSIDGHRNDDLRPYVYVTRDYGQTWTDISAGLPERGNVNTIREDPRNPRLVYAGTEFGFFVSLDAGATWNRFMPNLPVVRIDDVLVHPRDNDLVLATHGRSIWVMDDITALQGMTPELLASNLHLFDPREAVLWKSDIRQERSVTGDKNWTGENAPDGTMVSYYLGSASDGEVLLQIIDPLTDEVIRNLDATADEGLNRVHWNLREDPEDPDDNFGDEVEPGVYQVRLVVDGEARTQTVEVIEDVWLDIGG